MYWDPNPKPLVENYPANRQPALDNMYCAFRASRTLAEAPKRMLPSLG